MKVNPYQSPDLLHEHSPPNGDGTGLLAAVMIGITKAILETFVVLIIACAAIFLLAWLLNLAGAWAV